MANSQPPVAGLPLHSCRAWYTNVHHPPSNHGHMRWVMWPHHIQCPSICAPTACRGLGVAAADCRLQRQQRHACNQGAHPKQRIRTWAPPQPLGRQCCGAGRKDACGQCRCSRCSGVKQCSCSPRRDRNPTRQCERRCSLAASILRAVRQLWCRQQRRRRWPQ